MIEVHVAGVLTTVQDLGRPGHAHLGVARSGALDPPALRLANRIVGNDPGAAGLEITLTGCTIRCLRPVIVAVTGAPARIAKGRRECRAGAAIPLGPGDVLEVGPALIGARSYLAVAGGFEVPPVLGSRSTDTLSGLGPAPLKTGDVLPVGPPRHGPAPASVDFVPTQPAGGPVHLRLHFGPRDDWFAPEARALLARPYTLSMHANRVGARLAGPPLPRVDPGRQLPSEGVVLGAVQVTSDGRPLVFLADHPTTAGYPVLGVVHHDDLPALAQARPGDSVYFHGSER